jgi:hypothetical protein
LLHFSIHFLFSLSSHALSHISHPRNSHFSDLVAFHVFQLIFNVREKFNMAMMMVGCFSICEKKDAIFNYVIFQPFLLYPSCCHITRNFPFVFFCSERFLLCRIHIRCVVSAIWERTQIEWKSPP